MKSPAAYYLLLLYVSVMFKPLIPILDDAWSHAFSGIEHISLVHAKYGSNHVQKNIADAEQSEKNHPSSSTLKNSEQVAYHLTLSNPYNIRQHNVKIVHDFNTPPVTWLNVLVEITSPPPRFL